MDALITISFIIGIVVLCHLAGKAPKRRLRVMRALMRSKGDQMNVFVCVYEHKYGHDVFVFSSQDKADAKFDELNQEYWDGEDLHDHDEAFTCYETPVV